MNNKKLQLLIDLDINDEEIRIENIWVNGKKKRVKGIKKASINPATSWKAIPGYEAYMANASGEIYSTKTDTILEGWVSPINGSFRVNLNGDVMDVKDIIGALFVSNPKNYWKIININGDQTDNRAENLLFIPAKASRKNQLNKARVEKFSGKKLRG